MFIGQKPQSVIGLSMAGIPATGTLPGCTASENPTANTPAAAAIGGAMTLLCFNTQGRT